MNLLAVTKFTSCTRIDEKNDSHSMSCSFNKMRAPSEGCYKKAGFAEPFSKKALNKMGAVLKTTFAPSRALRSKYPKYEDEKL